MCTQTMAAKSVTWHPPKKGVVRDSKAAITIAHAVWLSMNPDLQIGNEKAWQSGMTASLHNGIWHVAEKPLSHQELGGGLQIDISQRDGRITGIYLTQ
ncbi:MAG TPA: hypothetical protein VFJ87_03590 [Rhodanobacteraceae bacterium]|nr:hypothetical protein [Rhodanobacteraceae bacterium]